jgi:hypothetical protein
VCSRPAAAGQRARPSTGLRHRLASVDERLVPLPSRLARSSRVPTLVFVAGALAVQCLALGTFAPPAPARAGQTPAKAVVAVEAGAPPVVRAVALSRSLRTVLRKGLAVRYSVGEEVAGHFEVLLARSFARRIGLRGSPPRGLPRGAARQIVIGRALLVTIAGGRNTLRLPFGRASVARLRRAARLRRLHKVALTLRLVVRNAKTPVTTTLIRRFVLSA